MIDVITQIKDTEQCRFSTVDFKNGETAEHRVRLDLEYWPTRDFQKDPKLGWGYNILGHIG